MLFGRNIRNDTVIDLQDERLLAFLGINPSEVNVKGKNALKVATVFSCFRILTESVGKIPIKVYENGKKSSDHYLNYLLQIRPNPLMSAIDYKKAVEFQLDLHGNAVVYIEKNKRTGLVTGLYPIDWKKISKIVVDDETFTKKKMWFIVSDKGKDYKVSFEDVLHFKGLTDNGLLGISAIDYLKDVIETNKSGQTYVNNFYKNGMQSKGIIQYIGDLNDKAEETFKAKFEQMSNGLKNAHKISLLPLGYQYQEISQKLADSQFFENNSLSIREIASAFGVKMHQINDLTRATFSNTEEMNKEFYGETLQPKLTVYEQEYTYKLLRPDEIETGHYMRFNIDAIFRSDLEKRFNAYRNAIQNGIYTSNEVRELEEREAKMGGDELLINGNMIPVRMAGIQYQK